MSVFRHPQSTPARNYQNDMNFRMPKPPEKPLQPYMRYSRKMWPKVRAENPDAQLWDIGKIIGKMWQETTDAERSIYIHEFELERAEYEKQWKNFQNNGFSNYMSSKGRAKHNEKMSRSRMDAGGVVIQPVDEDDGANDMSTRRLAGVRFERNNRLISDLFSPSIVTDTRTIVAQQRMDMLKRQASSLAQHQSKLEEELIKLQTIHNERKRAIEKGSDDFQEQLKKVVNEKPVVDEAKFEEAVIEWEGKLKEAYVEYKKKQDEISAKIAATTTNAAPVLKGLVMDEPPKENSEKEKDEKEDEKEEEKEEEENEKEKEKEKEDENKKEESKNEVEKNKEEEEEEEKVDEEGKEKEEQIKEIKKEDEKDEKEKKEIENKKDDDETVEKEKEDEKETKKEKKIEEEEEEEEEKMEGIEESKEE